jgi:hypothetical protein
MEKSEAACICGAFGTRNCTAKIHVAPEWPPEWEARTVGTPKDCEDMLVAVLRNTIHAIGINATCKLLASTIQGMGYAKHLRRFS